MGFLYAITGILLMSLLHPVLGAVSAAVALFMAWLYSHEPTKEQKEATRAEFDAWYAAAMKRKKESEEMDKKYFDPFWTRGYKE